MCLFVASVHRVQSYGRLDRFTTPLGQSLDTDFGDSPQSRAASPEPMRVPHLQEIDPRIGLLDAAIGTVLETQGDLHAQVFSQGPPERRVLAKIERCAEALAVVVDGATRLFTLVERASMAAAGKPLQCEFRAGLLNSVGSQTLANACAATQWNGLATL
jgi:hypothetical protein